jgi:hypothetical protein
VAHRGEQVDKALETTAIQRALGYSYETQKAFQTGVRMTVTETLPPPSSCSSSSSSAGCTGPVQAEQRGGPYPQRPGALFQEFLKRMDNQNKLEDQRQVIDIPPNEQKS